MLRLLAKYNEEIDTVVLENVPKNHQMTVQDIKYIYIYIANAIASETLYTIIKDLEDSSFSILVDESCDIVVTKIIN